MTLTRSKLRIARMLGSASLATIAALALQGCYQSSLKEPPPVRFTQNQLGQPLENLLGDPKEGEDKDSTVEAYPASIQNEESPSRPG